MVNQLGKNAKKATKEIARLSELEKNSLLEQVAFTLVKRKNEILDENQKDLVYAKSNNISQALYDRLLLTTDRIKEMANGLKTLMHLTDNIGKIIEMNKRPNGLQIGKKIVPMGVIGIIYEARPNVTIDAFGLCFKTNNCVILRGGKEAIHSNMKLVEIVREVLDANNINKDAIQIVTDTSRKSSDDLMKMNDYLDLLIPRGGQGLINAVVKNSTVPVIQTGVGNCHVYVDEYANINMALDITYNAKVQRPGVCNSCETVIVHKKVASEFLEKLGKRFKGIVAVKGDNVTCEHISYATTATTEDYHTEFNDYIISIITVKSLDEAIDHIDEYSTNHSESIVTDNYQNAQRFLEEVDSSAVYVNASTRFTDGFEFGYGAEIGISTQKLHARGPMGLNELTTIKYVIYGNGQIRQ